MLRFTQHRQELTLVSKFVCLNSLFISSCIFVPLSFVLSTLWFLGQTLAIPCKNEKITITNILPLGAGNSCLLCKLCGQIVINTNSQHTLFFFTIKLKVVSKVKAHINL